LKNNTVTTYADKEVLCDDYSELVVFRNLHFTGALHKAPFVFAFAPVRECNASGYKTSHGRNEMKNAMLIITQGSPLRYTEPFLSGIWDQVSRSELFEWVELGCTEREADCFAAVERLAEKGVLDVVVAPLILMDCKTERRKIMDIFAKLVAKFSSISFALSKGVTADVHIAALITESASNSMASQARKMGEDIELFIWAKS